MRKLTNRQIDIIHDNLCAFVHNFGNVRIERTDYGTGFYVFFPALAQDYIQYCKSIDYLDGWLYGAVQGAVCGEFKPFRTGGLSA